MHKSAEYNGSFSRKPPQRKRLVYYVLRTLPEFCILAGYEGVHAQMKALLSQAFSSFLGTCKIILHPWIINKITGFTFLFENKVLNTIEKYIYSCIVFSGSVCGKMEL